MEVSSWSIIVLTILNFTALKACKIKENYEREIPFFLQNFVQIQGIPSQAILFLCYRVDSLIHIAKHSHISININNLEEFEIPLDDKGNAILFVNDMNCPGTKKFLQEVVLPKYYSHPFRWIIIQENRSSYPEIRALVDSSVYLVTPLDHGKMFKLEQFYKIYENSSVNVEPYGIWSASNGFSIVQKETIVSRRRQNLQGKLMRVNIVLTNNSSLSHLYDFREKHVDSVTKVNFILTTHLMDCLNAKMLYLPLDSWGYRNIKTGIWDGVMHNMVEKSVDIGCSLFITTDRLPYVDYLSLTSPTKAKFIFREPPLSYVCNIYSLPFSGTVWVTSGLLIVFSFIVILVTMKLQAKVERKRKLSGPCLRFSDLALSGISAICQMGILFETKILSARISALFLLLALVFLFTYYTANIVALLQSTTKSIQTLTDLLNSQLELGVQDMPYNRYYFQSATDTVKKDIYEKKVISSEGVPRFMNITEGIAKVQQGLFAFNVELGVGYQIIEELFYEHEKCNLMTIQYLDVNDPWYAVPKNSPYKEIIKVNLFKMREYGLQHRINSKIYTKKPVCSANGQNFGSVRLSDCYAALKILLVGYALAVTVFVLEKTFKNRSVFFM